MPKTTFIMDVTRRAHENIADYLFPEIAVDNILGTSMVTYGFQKASDGPNKSVVKNRGSTIATIAYKFRTDLPGRAVEVTVESEGPMPEYFSRDHVEFICDRYGVVLAS